jgi:phytoene desaturase
MMTLAEPPADRPVQIRNGPDLRPHAIIIGSGFGGLAAAVRLGAKGYRVTVLERLPAPGGRAIVHRQDGFTFDAGPTVLTIPHLFEELWALCGRNLAHDVPLHPVTPFYAIRFDDGSVFRYTGDPTAMRAEVARFSPADVEGFDRFVAYTEALCVTGFDRLGDQPFLKFTDMLAIAPQLLKLGGHRSVYATVSRFFRDPKLRQVFSYQPLLIGGNPFSASAIYAMIPAIERRWGVWRAQGGTGALIAGLVRLIHGQGGTVRLNADVAEILVENASAKGVRLTDGETLHASLVVSNADTANTYRELIAPHVKRGWRPERMEMARHSMSLFVWYFGTDRQYKEVDQHTIALGPRYKGLLDDIFHRRRIAPDMSLYLHRSSHSDPTLAPAGCDSFYVLCPVPNLSGGQDWETEAEPLRLRVQARLEATLLPGLSRHIVTSRLMTPRDFETRLRAYKGAAFSLEPVLTQSAWFRPHNAAEGIANLYLVGAGTHPGAGVPGVLSTARALDRLIPHAQPASRVHA